MKAIWFHFMVVSQPVVLVKVASPPARALIKRRCSGATGGKSAMALGC